MDIWEIKLNSDECQYCEPPFQPDGIYLCKQPGENWGKECIVEMCPVAILTPDAADVKGCDHEWESVAAVKCEHCGLIVED